MFQTSNPYFRHYASDWFGVAEAFRDIHRYDGLLGLYRGHSATLLRIFPYAAVRFLAYEQIRAFVIPSKDYETSLRRLLSGSLAGMTSVSFTYPLELVRVRLAFETKHNTHSSLRHAFRRIYHEHARPVGQTPSQDQKPTKGTIINFYRGFSPTILGILPYAGMSFLTHDTIGDLLRHYSLAQYTTIPVPPEKDFEESKKGVNRRRPQLKASAELFSGAISGLVSQSCSYPLEIIRRRMQIGGVVGDGHRLKILETARIIFQEQGLRGFWVGLTIGYMKVVPMVATSFFVYERCKWWLGI